MKHILFLCVTLLSLTALGYAQTPQIPEGAALKQTILRLDSAMFEAYNSCDMQKFESYFAKDVKFYHDRGGYMDGSQGVIAATQKYICGKVSRKLVPETAEIYPIPGYGAIQYGTHRFKNYGEGDKEYGLPAKFMTIWQFKDGNWKATQVISYDHH